MKTSTIHVRNMCCDRCIRVITEEMQKLGLPNLKVKMGEFSYSNSKKVSEKAIENSLVRSGFEIIRNKDEELVENIVTAILNFVHHPEKNEINKRITIPEYLSALLSKPYNHLSKIFSDHKKITIERFVILQKIERAKELIEYGEFSFSEIAFVLDYNSPQYLSVQFKEVAGMSMKDYKQAHAFRKGIDKVK